MCTFYSNMLINSPKQNAKKDVEAIMNQSLVCYKDNIQNIASQYIK